MNAAGYVVWAFVIVGAVFFAWCVVSRRRTGPPMRRVEHVMAAVGAVLALVNCVIVPVLAEPSDQPWLTRYVTWTLILTVILGHRIRRPRDLGGASRG